MITKDPDNHFWTSMVEGAQKAAKDKNAQITVEAGRDQSDADGQIQAIENAISRGDKAILIAHNDPAVSAVIKKARDAGLYVLALDTPTDLVDATLASEQFRGRHIDRKRDFVNTGIKLITDQPVSGLKSIDSKKGTELCW